MRGQLVGTVCQWRDVGEPPIFKPLDWESKTRECVESLLTQFDEPRRRGLPLESGVLFLIRFEYGGDHCLLVEGKLKCFWMNTGDDKAVSVVRGKRWFSLR